MFGAERRDVSVCMCVPIHLSGGMDIEFGKVSWERVVKLECQVNKFGLHLECCVAVL